jgi:hypothetical protein
MACVKDSSLLAHRMRSEHTGVHILSLACVCESACAFSLLNFSAQDTTSAVIRFGMSGTYCFTRLQAGGLGVRVRVCGGTMRS